MVGVELLAGYTAAYLVRKARRVAGRADAEVDQILDEGMDRLHELVAGQMGDDHALSLLVEQAEAGAESERTVRRVKDALEEAAEGDPNFREALQQLVTELQERDSSTRGAAAGAVYNEISGGIHHGPVIQGRDFSGPVSFGTPLPKHDAESKAETWP